jgi:hypothetical protein
MSLQYLETLRALGSGQATKIVIPMEFTSMLQPLLNLTGAAQTPAPAAPASALTVSEANGHDRSVSAPALTSIAAPDQQEDVD